MPRPDLAKPIPEADVSSILPPNDNYEYFRDHLEHPFDARVGMMPWVTTSWCADAALLAYFDEARVRWECNRAGSHETQFLEQANTQCFIARTDQFALVAFRGTTILKPGANLTLSDIRGSANAAFDALRDVLTDAAIIPRGNVHAGFRQALSAVWPQLQAFRTKHPALPMWFTGHSLGGALAVLAADRYNRAGGSVGGVYTFGCPVVGDKKFARKYALLNRTFRFVNNNDWLPKLELGYQHIGQLRYITSQGDISAETNLADQLAGAASHALDIFKSWAKFNFDVIPSDALRDHAPIYYATHLWNYYVHQL
jgi:hypothetical protein